MLTDRSAELANSLSTENMKLSPCEICLIEINGGRSSHSVMGSAMKNHRYAIREVLIRNISKYTKANRRYGRPPYAAGLLFESGGIS